MGKQKERPQRWNVAKGKRRGRNLLVVFIWIEWCCEWLDYWLSRWAFISILEHLGKLAIIFTLVLWIASAADRKQAQENQRKTKIFQAWQVINAAEGKPVSGGRDLAMRDLIHEGESLSNVDLSNAILSSADLSGALLGRANLNNAELSSANLSGAYLRAANLQWAHLISANLSGANLRGANLSGAELRGANLSNTTLVWARLDSADLSRANLSGAGLGAANLSGAKLRAANLSGANLYRLKNWREIGSLNRANVWEVENAPKGFLEWAIGEMGAVSIENDEEWKAMIKNETLYRAWKEKWDQEHAVKQQ